ncbi:MAG: short-chain dehydrogenase, partial [Myxococcales bacterium]|nr:short-chain dehydrogenase [Myxococcales bacterium]
VLAAKGFKGQQTDQPIRPDRPDDLYEPAAGDYGAHGEFDARAKAFSLAWWLSKHRAAIAGGLAVAAAAGGLGLAARHARPRW